MVLWMCRRKPVHIFNECISWRNLIWMKLITDLLIRRSDVKAHFDYVHNCYEFSQLCNSENSSDMCSFLLSIISIHPELLNISCSQIEENRLRAELDKWDNVMSGCAKVLTQHTFHSYLTNPTVCFYAAMSHDPFWPKEICSCLDLIKH